MSNYAVVKIDHRQYLVEPDQVYTVDKFPAEVGDKVELDVVLKVVDGKVAVGTPTVDGAKVNVEIIEQGKGEKVTSKIFKAKARYRRTRGLRKQVTTFKVLGIK